MIALPLLIGSISVAAEEVFLGIPQEQEASAQQFANSKSESITGANMVETLQTELMPNERNKEFVQSHKEQYPFLNEYKVSSNSKETLEEHKFYEESEKVPFKCKRKLKLICEKSKECDNGGIILSSVKTNLEQQSYNYPTLYVRTPYWAPHYCTKDDTKYTTFEVKDLEMIKSVTLTRVQFDDYLLIKINDKKVYLGPEDDGDRLTVIGGSRYGSITTNGSNRKACERATNWNRYPNIDLKPYLQEGDNKISITLVTAGYGNSQIWIDAVQNCCDKWVETWEDVCEQELKEL